MSIGAIVVLGLGVGVYYSQYSPPEYPAQPDTLNETSAVSYAASYERAYASEEMLESDHGLIEDIQFRFGKTTVTKRGDGYRVLFEDVHLWVNNAGGGHLDRWYHLTYFVNETVIQRNAGERRWVTQE